MKTSYQHRGRGVPAFTLVEIIVVMAIIAVLATMTVGGLGWYKNKAATGRTEVLISSIERALEDFKSDNGFYPQGDGGAGSTTQVYIALFGDGKLQIDNATGEVSIGTAPDGDNTDDDDGTTYLDTLNPTLPDRQRNVEQLGLAFDIIDAWGEPLGYRHNPTVQAVKDAMMNPANDFDLWSKGANGNGYPDSAVAEDIADDIKNW